MSISKGPPSDDNVAKPLAARPEPDPLLPGMPLDQIGHALASVYDDLLSEGVPESLAKLVRRVDPVQDRGADKEGRLAIVVEDDPDIRQMAVTLLEATRLDAIGCDSAERALDILQERGGQVALVFADIRLAGKMDGVQLAHAVATLWPKARLVVTSGAAQERSDEIPHGAVFIAKPWRSADILVHAEHASGKPPPAVA